MRNLLCNFLAAGTMVLALGACSSAPQKVPYIVDAETIPVEVLSQAKSAPATIITQGDLLNILVTGTNMAAMAPFNKGMFLDPDGKIMELNHSYNSTYQNAEYSTEYYLVDPDGYIEFPIVGKVKAAGLTKSNLAKEIADAIYPKYVNEKPSVDIRLMNFRVTVAGAVKNPGVYQSKNENMTFLEAISMAGDLDIKGERENVLLYRTNADGTREVHRLDLHDKDFLLSPYYNLQQNDVIYVTPNKSMRSTAWSLSPAVTATITIVGGLSSVASLVIGIVNLAK